VTPAGSLPAMFATFSACSTAVFPFPRLFSHGVALAASFGLRSVKHLAKAARCNRCIGLAIALDWLPWLIAATAFSGGLSRC
jgi:hypothetical protein